MPSESQRMSEAHGSRERVVTGEKREMLTEETVPSSSGWATQTSSPPGGYEVSLGILCMEKAMHIFMFC